MTKTQRGVLVGMASALLVAAGIFISAVVFVGPTLAVDISLEIRIRLLAASVLAPAISLLICIARLAKHRFFTPEDINGSALTEGTAHAKLLQALLQNTLEQLALAVPVYLSCAFIFEGRFLVAIPAAAVMFFVGRILFFVGYANGAPSRAFGFAFTFYPTALLAGSALYFLITLGE